MKEQNIASIELLNDDLENYFNNTIIPQLFVDAGLVLRKFTPPAMKQFNLHASDIGKVLNDLVDNIRFPGIIDNIKQVINSGILLEKEIQTTDMHWYQMNILPYFIRHSGLTNGVIITFVDITTRIRDLKELEKLIAEHQILFDTITHDIKNPLTNINLSIELLRDDGASHADLNAGLDIIARAAQRIKEMLDEFTAGRQESGIQNTEAELLHMENILEDVFIALTIQIQAEKAVVNTNIEVSEIYFSRRKLRSVLYNLLSNALKYRSDNNQCIINVSTKREGDKIIIRVADNGPGIPQDKQEAIFKKYYRIQSSVEGSGIGLYLVRQIVQAGGGEIRVESEPGKGTIFTVYLPA